MPLTGDYEPSAMSFARDQVDLYERSGGTEGTEQGGKLRKTPLMRVEHDAEYAVAAWPDYAEYQKKTTRTIPVFVLTPSV